jgi:hypothetical protein
MDGKNKMNYGERKDEQRSIPKKSNPRFSKNIMTTLQLVTQGLRPHTFPFEEDIGGPK